MPANGRLKANQNSASETRLGGLGVEVAAFEHEPGDRGGEHDHERRRGDQQQVDLAHPGAHGAAQRRRVAAGGQAAENREQDGRDRHAEHALGQHVDAKGVVDRPRGLFGDEAAEGRVDQLIEVDDPEADRDRQHQHEHLLDARVVPVEAELQAEVDPPERAQCQRHLHDGRRQDPDRVGVDLLFAVKVGREHDQQHDDHDVPHRRGDRRDREFVVGLQDAHEQAGQPEQQHDREQHLGETDRQVSPCAAELRTDEQRHDHPRGEDEERR